MDTFASLKFRILWVILGTVWMGGMPVQRMNVLNCFFLVSVSDVNNEVYYL